MCSLFSNACLMHFIQIIALGKKQLFESNCEILTGGPKQWFPEKNISISDFVTEFHLFSPDDTDIKNGTPSIRGFSHVCPICIAQTPA